MAKQKGKDDELPNPEGKGQTAKARKVEKEVGDEERKRHSKPRNKAAVQQGRQQQRNRSERPPNGEWRSGRRGGVAGRKDRSNTFHGTTQSSFTGNSILNTANKGVFMNPKPKAKHG